MELLLRLNTMEQMTYLCIFYSIRIVTLRGFLSIKITFQKTLLNNLFNHHLKRIPRPADSVASDPVYHRNSIDGGIDADRKFRGILPMT